MFGKLVALAIKMLTLMDLLPAHPASFGGLSGSSLRGSYGW